MISTHKSRIETNGNCDIIDITELVSKAIIDSRLKAGIITVFVAHSTCGITTIEYESGLVADLQELFDRIAPKGIHYAHDARWGDGNGHSHVRASLVGGSLTVPFSEARPILGTWQQVILIDFDNRARTREIVFQVIGE